MKGNKCIPILLGVVLCLCSVARSDMTNGGFETGDLTDWTTTGTVGAVKSEYARDFLGLPQPPGPPDYTWYPTEGSWFASLWSTDSAGTDASSLSRTFDALAGDTLTFDYFYDFGDVAVDPDTGAPYYDPARIYLEDSSSTVVFEMTINDPAHGTALGDDENIDWTPVSWLLPSAGQYTLGFEISDSIGAFESYLGVDNVDVVPIPAPGAVLLGSIGMGLAGLLRKRWMV